MIVLSEYTPLGLLLAMLISPAFQSCHVQPEVRVEPAAPPVFSFSKGTAVDGLLVYHLNGNRDHKGILLDTLLADKENTNWMIEGEHDNQEPITYGVVPVGMKATIQPKPLIEGEFYMVYATSLVGAKFVIRDGIAQPVARDRN